MINAERILQTLDRHLDHDVRLVIYGRAAIAPGFDNPPETVKHSLDVDGIISISQAPVIRADSNFWDAQEATNAELDKNGLYITHLFEADQVFLRRDWEQHLSGSCAMPSTRRNHAFVTSHTASLPPRDIARRVSVSM